MNLARCAPRSLLAVASLATLGAGGACGASSPDAVPERPQPGAATVTVEAFQFEPDPIVVSVGTAIRFVNRDAIDHTVTAGTREAPLPERFDGQLPDEGATFELVLDEPGTYEYFCEIHPGPGMTGSVIVQ